MSHKIQSVTLTFLALATLSACGGKGSPAQQLGKAIDNLKSPKPSTPTTNPSPTTVPATPLTLAAFKALPKHAMPYQFAPGELANLCDAIIAETKSQVDAFVGQGHPGEKDFNKGLLPLETLLADYNDLIGRIETLSGVSLIAGIRDESNDCSVKDQKFSNDLMARPDLYAIVKDVSPKNEAQSRLLGIYMMQFEQSGVQLDAAKRSELLKKLDLQADMETSYTKNIREEKGTIKFSPTELDGVPESVYDKFDKDADGNFIVPLLEEPFTAVLQDARLSETRKKLDVAYLNVATPANVVLLKKILQVRQEIADLLGFKNYADLKLSQNRMAKNVDTVMNFLGDLQGKLTEGAARDYATLLDYKKQLDPQADHLDPWDVWYLEYQLKKSKYKLDDEKIREYFPADTVVKGMFEVYSTLLGIRIENVPGVYWTPDVKLYKVFNANSTKVIAYFYTDLMTRRGKDSGAYARPLIVGRRLANGRYDVPTAMILANFKAPRDSKPSLLTHEEVVTVFHEFGHIMHNVLTRVAYASIAGTSVAQDYVEAPSQMLENFVFEPEILDKLSGHYLRPNEKLSPELLAQIKAARSFMQSRQQSSQLLFATLDMNYNIRRDNFDPHEEYEKLYREVSHLEPIPNTHVEANFDHLIGYAAGYYSYLWSRVYSDDMFQTFKAGGLLNPTVGAHYRKTILEKGGAEDPMAIITEFLGHPPSNKPFLKRLGLLN